MDLDWNDGSAELPGIVIAADEKKSVVDDVYCKSEGLSAAEVTEMFYAQLRHL